MAYLYGLLSMADLANRRVTEVGVGEVSTAIDMSVAEHNRQMDALMALLARRTTDWQTRFRTPVAARLQPGDEFSRGRPIKPAGQYDVGLPLTQGDIAWGFNSVTGAYLTVGEAAEATNALLEADFRYNRDKMLSAFFVASSYTFVDPLHGSLTVQALANGDTVTYPVIRGADTEATDDHILTDAAADADTFATIYDDLTEHPDNGGDVFAFIPTNLKATVEGLSTFYPVEDPDLRQGTATTVLAGRLGTAIPGEVLGKIERVWVAEWRSLPDNYIIAITTEGPRPLAMREDPIPELNGFRRVADRDDYPWFERHYRRRNGFGAWNRTGGLVMQITAGAYSSPAGLDTPLL